MSKRDETVTMTVAKPFRYAAKSYVKGDTVEVFTRDVRLLSAIGNIVPCVAPPPAPKKDPEPLPQPVVEQPVHVYETAATEATEEQPEPEADEVDSSGERLSRKERRRRRYERRDMSAEGSNE